MKQARHKGEWDGTRLLFEVVLVFPTSEIECAGESWQDLRDNLSYWRQVATSNFAEGTWFLSPTSAGPGLSVPDDGNGPCARGFRPWIRGFHLLCSESWSHPYTIKLDLFCYGSCNKFGWPIRSRAQHTGPVCLLLAQLL